jgi:hypothetical protein
MSYMHLPGNVAQSAYASAAAEAIEKFVPHIRVNQVLFDESDNAGDDLTPVIEVTYYEK